MIPASPALVAILAFNASNQLAVRKLGSKAGLPFTGTDPQPTTARIGNYPQGEYAEGKLS